MSLHIQFQDTKLTLYGGDEYTLRGVLSSETSRLSSLCGDNGSGKTTILSAIALFFGYPSFGPVKSIDGTSIVSSWKVARVATVRQSPLANFIGGVLADEYRIVYANSTFDEQSFRDEMASLLDAELALGADVLARDPKELSAGVRQMAAIALALLSNADMVLLDEPLSRLSGQKAKEVVRLLVQHARRRYLIVTYHADDEVFFSSALRHQLERTSKLLLVRKEDGATTNDSPTADGPPCTLDMVGIDPASYDRARTTFDNFARLPPTAVHCIEGVGEEVLPPTDIEVFAGRRLTTSYSLRLRRGLNLLYADNGVGKTLIARVLSADIPINPLWTLASRLHARMPSSVLRTDGIKGLPSRVRLTTLRKRMRSMFLPSEPEDMLTLEATAEEELHLVLPLDEAKERLEWLRSLGVVTDRAVVDLSYGQRKLVAFSELPRQLVLAVLDEPFANLSPTMRRAVARVIGERVASGDWHVTVVTTNRPSDSVAVLCGGNSRTTHDERESASDR